MVDAPGVGQGGDERAVDHVPHLSVVLLFLVKDAVEGGSTFAHGETTEFGEDVGFFDTTVGADSLDLSKHLLGHIFIVVVGCKGGLAGEAASYVERVELWADAFEVAVYVDAFGQLVPVIGGVADAGVDEEMEHLEGEFGVGLHLLFIEADDIAVAHAEA